MKRGAVTLFFSLMLTVSLSFFLVVLESERISLIMTKAVILGDAAAESVMGAYDRTLLKTYGILGLNISAPGGVPDFAAAEERFSEYVDSGSVFGLAYGNELSISNPEAEISEAVFLTDYRGEILVRSALSGYRFSKASRMLQSLTEETEEKKEAEQILSECRAAAEDSISGSAKRRSRTRNFSEAVLPDLGILSQTGRALLSEVLPSGRAVSEGTLLYGDLPSQTAWDLRDLPEDSGSLSALQKVCFTEYLLDFFPGFTEEKSQTVHENELHYQREYLLNGKNADRRNLELTAEQLFLLRTGLNALSVRSDPELSDEVSEAANGLSGFLEDPGAVALTELLLTVTFSAREAKADLRTLYAGGKVPFVKTASDWNLSFSETDSGKAAGKGGEEGSTYRDHLRLLLYLTPVEILSYRAMDLMQAEMRKTDACFSMSSVLYAAEFELRFRIRPLFSGLPVVIRTVRRREDPYELTAAFSGSYE